MHIIELAETDEQINRCFAVMSQLRPHLTRESFLQRVRLQQIEGYLLAALSVNDTVQSCAGYRYCNMLAHGKFLYVDDLVTNEATRSSGYGDALFEWLLQQAQLHECESLQLDSGVQRFHAHRFYFRKRMHIASYHFGVKL